jgi:hypothetical protein
MKIRMLKTNQGRFSNEIDPKVYYENKEYDLGEELALIFLQMGVAEEVIKPENKKIATKVLKIEKATKNNVVKNKIEKHEGVTNE